MTAVMNLITYPGLAFTVFRKDKKGVMTVACVQFAANLLVLLINLGPSFSDLIPVFRMAAYGLLAFAAIRSGLEDGRIGWLWFLPGVFGLAAMAAWAGQSWFPEFFQSFMEMNLYDWVYAVAETAVKFVLAACGNLNEYQTNMATFERNDCASFKELTGLKATVFGVGRIG